MDDLAPEHLELITADDDWYFDRLTNYGSLFIGPWSTVAYSDKGMAGTNHVLPTAGGAKHSAGLSVEPVPQAADLPARGSKAATHELADAVQVISASEGMAAHEATATIRLAALEPRRCRLSRGGSATRRARPPMRRRVASRAVSACEHREGEAHDLGGRGGEHGALPLHERDGVVERLRERDEVQLGRAGAALGDRARDERVADAGRDEGERGLDLLHLDDRVEVHAGERRPLEHLAPRRVAPAVVRVVEHELAAREVLDRRRLRGACSGSAVV